MPAHPLDRTSALPLWAQLEHDLRRRIDSNEFSSGAFPTDMELTAAYDVSRHTVREAIRALNTSGLLRRERGRGTVIDRGEFEQTMGTLYSLFSSVEAAGAVQTSHLLEFLETTSEKAASHLGVPVDAPITFISRLRLADGEPLALDRAWLSVPAADLSSVDWSHTALYDELEKAGHRAPTHGWERLTPILPEPEDRRLLGLRARNAAFQLERLGMTDDKPLEWRMTVLRGDRYRFVNEWTRGAPSSLRAAQASTDS